MSVAGDPLDDMLGDEAVPARVATPQVADDIVRQVCGCLRCDHRVGANRARRKIASMRRGMEQGGRPDFSNRWHRDLLLRLIGLDFQVRYTHGLTMSQHKCVSFTNSSSAKLGFLARFLGAISWRNDFCRQAPGRHAGVLHRFMETVKDSISMF